MMGKPAIANNNPDTNNDDDDDESPALPFPTSSAFVTPRELPDQNKPTLAKESQRQRIISLSSSENGSASSSSSSDVHIIPAEPARKPIARAKKLRVVESPISSPPAGPSKKEHVAILKAKGPALMARKDSNNIPLSSSPIKKGKEPAAVTKKKAVEVHTVEEKENSRPHTQPALPKPVEARPSVVSTLSYLTPNVPLHSTPARPHTSQRKSTTTSTSTSSNNYLLNRPMALPPPRGHGQHADVAWRRPLTPLVHSDRYGANRNAKRPKQQQQEKQIKEKPKRPPREREPVSPIAASKRPAANVAVAKRKSIIEVVIPRSRTASPQAGSDKSSIQPSTEDSTSSVKSVGKRVIGLSAESDSDISIEIIRSRDVPPESASQEQVERGVNIQPSSAASDLGQKAEIFVPDDVKPLLQACSPYSNKIHDFSSIINVFPLLPSHTAAQSFTWAKLGEATYSEVFVVSTSTDSEKQDMKDEIVVKVIPIHRPSSGHVSHDVVEEDLPQTSLIQDVVREVEITKLLSKGANMADAGNVSGFTHLRGAYLASGQYPARLLSAWDDFSKSHPEKGENARPDVFPDTQLYLLLCLSHGGTDLESFRVKNWEQACSILHQVATSLASAENETQFEHRDLHWGNILIKTLDEPIEAVENGSEVLPDCLRATSRDVTATIIDFTLSRATLKEGRILSGGLEDEALFDGEGDQQYECYRLMRRLIKGDWQAFCPITNVVWLHYLALKLLSDKKLKKPVRKAAGPRTRTLASRAVSHTGTPTKPRTGKPTITSAIQDYEQEKAAYDSLKAALAILSASIETALAAVEATNGAGKPKRKGRAAKTSASSQETEDSTSAQVCASAGEFVLWWTHA